MLGQPARLAAVDGHHVELGLVVVAGPQKGEPAAVGEKGADVAAPEVKRRGGAEPSVGMTHSSARYSSASRSIRPDGDGQ